MSRFNLRDLPRLDNQTKETILAEVFQECGQTPNSIPLEELRSYADYRRDRHGLLYILLAVILVIFLAMPFLFISPQFTVTLDEENDDRYPTYTVHLKECLLPVSSVSARSEDGHVYAVYETGENTYSVTPTYNGTVEIRIQLVNRQYNTVTITVDDIDTDAPVLTENEVTDGNLILHLEDTGSGIDYETAYAVYGTDDTPVSPVAYDETAGTIAFSYEHEDMNIYIYDHKNNLCHLVLTVEKE